MYVLSFDTFLYERIDIPNNDTDFLRHLSKYGNGNPLAKYGLKKLKDQRQIEYKKIFNAFKNKEDLKEAKKPYDALWNRLQEIDDACDKFMYLLCEFRTALRDYDSIHHKVYQQIKRNSAGDKTYEYDAFCQTFINFARQKNYKDLIFSYEETDANGEYFYKEDLIKIYVQNCFDHIIQLEGFLWGEEDYFKDILEGLSLLVYHELTHKFQYLVDPKLFITYETRLKKRGIRYYTHKLLQSNFDYCLAQYYNSPEEVGAYAMLLYRQLRLLGYKDDDIKSTTLMDKVLKLPIGRVYQEIGREIGKKQLIQTLMSIPDKRKLLNM